MPRNSNPHTILTRKGAFLTPRKRCTRETWIVASLRLPQRLRGLIRLQRSDDSAQLPLWALSVGVSTWIADLEPYEPARVAGVVDRTRIGPVEGVIDASVSDGSARLIARWHIRRPTPELAVVPGRFVILTGAARLEEDILVMVEPEFELVERYAAA